VNNGTPGTSRLVRACRLQPLDRTPVWFMRQAGRFLPEYRRIRESHTLLEICSQPDVTVEVTLQPTCRFELDAAIIFADILLPLVPMGAGLSFATNEGPVIDNGVETVNDVERLRTFEVREELASTLESIRLTRRALPAETALIGFAGAPFTLASYLIEGGTSKRFVRTKSFMYREAEAFHALMRKLALVTQNYLVAQIEAGADVVQVFDSWVGWLGPDDYRDFVLPHMRAIFEAVHAAGAPAIHFGVDTGGLLELIREAGGDVIGLDWRIPLDEGWRRVGHDHGVQGNLDPAVLFGPAAAIAQRTRAILVKAASRPGHIFNLGHGIMPETPIESVMTVIETVHAHGAASR
jgi:uroporphyrinogen decarboxylase